MAKRIDDLCRMSRRQFAWLTAPFAAALLARNPSLQAAEAPGIPLIRDPDFQRGFLLLRPEPGKRVECGMVRGPGREPSVWSLAQWSSRFPFDGSTPVGQAPGSARVLSNPARRVVFGGEDRILSLAVNTGIEYGERLREKGEPWVHLLVSQPLRPQPRLGDLSALRFGLNARLVRSVELQEDQDPRIHAAQCLLFISVQNLEKGHRGFGDFLWFGVPIYDNRTRDFRTYAAPDFAGSNKFIYTPAPHPPARPNIHDGDWAVFDLDLLPRMLEGLAVARSRGYLGDLEDHGAYRVAAINVGWEVPGTYDVEIQLRGLRLLADP
jgi:hypothetical protein